MATKPNTPIATTPDARAESKNAAETISDPKTSDLVDPKIDAKAESKNAKTLEIVDPIDPNAKGINPKIHDTLADLQKSTCGSVNAKLPEMDTEIVYPLPYAKDPFLKNLWEVTLKNLKDASKPLEILEAVASTAMLEGYIAKFATSVLEGVITDNDMRDMLVSGIKTFTTTKLAGLSLEQFGKVSKVIESSASSPDLAMLMIQQLGKAMVKPDAAAIRRKLGKLDTDCSAESKADEVALAARNQEIMTKEEAERIDRANADQDYQRTQTTRQERSERLKKEFKELELQKKEAEKAETKVPVKVAEPTAIVPVASAPQEGAVVPTAASETPAPLAPEPPASETPAPLAPEPPAPLAPEPPASETPAPLASETPENPDLSESKEKKGGQKTRRRGERQRKTRKHWLLFTLRDIL